MLNGVHPATVHLLTWEFATHFDAVPTSKVLNEAFEKEFPKTMERLKEKGWFRLYPLVSFNASEGRISRYLVAWSEEPFEKAAGRFLPQQCFLYGAADKAMRCSATAKGDCQNNGNYLFFHLNGGLLSILVFFEGRLCHWSEEGGYNSDDESLLRLEERLRRFNQFLKSDSLFSRAEFFVQKELKPMDLGTSKILFKRASKDPFWRHLDLRKKETSQECGWGRIKLLFLLLVTFVAALLGLFCHESAEICSDCKEAPATELLPFPKIIQEIPLEELVEKVEHPTENAAVAKDGRCPLPEFKVRGVVAEKLAVVVAGSGALSLAPGDSLGDYAVASIGKNHVVFVCGKSQLLREVEN